MSQSASPITVLVVEDDLALCHEFVAMIDATPGFALVDAVGSLSTARAMLRKRGAPDTLIIDLGLPDGDGTELIRELTASAPATCALVITVFGDERHVVRALEAGAKGYLLKDVTRDEFSRAIRLVHEGGAPLSPMIARHVLKKFSSARQDSGSPPLGSRGKPVEKLTPREAEILQMIARGHSVAETAAALQLSAHTVTTHIKHVYGKLAVRNRVQAVNRARAAGQID